MCKLAWFEQKIDKCDVDALILLADIMYEKKKKKKEVMTEYHFVQLALALVLYKHASLVSILVWLDCL